MGIRVGDWYTWPIMGTNAADAIVVEVNVEPGGLRIRMRYNGMISNPYFLPYDESTMTLGGDWVNEVARAIIGRLGLLGPGQSPGDTRGEIGR